MQRAISTALSLQISDRLLTAGRRLAALICNPPDLLAAIVAQEQRAIAQLQQADRPAPDFALVGRQHEAGEERAHLSGRPRVLERDEGHGVADELRSVREA